MNVSVKCDDIFSFVYKMIQIEKLRMHHFTIWHLIRCYAIRLQKDSLTFELIENLPHHHWILKRFAFVVMSNHHFLPGDRNIHCYLKHYPYLVSKPLIVVGFGNLDARLPIANFVFPLLNFGPFLSIYASLSRARVRINEWLVLVFYLKQNSNFLLFQSEHLLNGVEFGIRNNPTKNV